MIQSFCSGLEQVFGATVKREQPILGVLVGFNATVTKHVRDLDPALLDQMPRDEQEPMTIDWIVLAAHEGGTAASGDFDNPFDPNGKGRCASHGLVVGKTVC
jgi:hypothetical protein